MLRSKLAPNAFTTLETMKEMLSISAKDTNAQRDDVIINLINGASAWVERKTGRKLSKNTYTEKYVASGAQELVLLQYPILEVGYIKDTESGAIVDEREYDVSPDGEIGVLYRDNGWRFRGYTGGLAYDNIAPMRYLEVNYTAGYVLPKDATKDNPATLPYDLQAVVWSVVSQEFALMQNGAQGLSAFSISDVSWTFDKEPRQEWLDTIGYYTRL